MKLFLNLPHYVLIQDIARAMAILAGALSVKKPHARPNTWLCETDPLYWFSSVVDLKNAQQPMENPVAGKKLAFCEVQSHSSFFNPHIHFLNVLKEKRSVCCFLEGDENYKVFQPEAEPFWGAMGKRLIELFSGIVLYDYEEQVGTQDEQHIKKINVAHGILSKQEYFDFDKKQEVFYNISPLTRQEYTEASFLCADKHDPTPLDNDYWRNFLSATDALIQNRMLLQKSKVVNLKKSSIL